MDTLLKILGDRNRLKILRLLSIEELCVCELEMLLELTQSNVSRHLSKMKNQGIITSIKDAQWIHYKISDDFMKDHSLLLGYLLSEFDKDEEFISTKDRLEKYQSSALDCTDIRSDIDSVKSKLYKCNC